MISLLLGIIGIHMLITAVAIVLHLLESIGSAWAENRKATAWLLLGMLFAVCLTVAYIAMELWKWYYRIG